MQASTARGLKKAASELEDWRILSGNTTNQVAQQVASEVDLATRALSCSNLGLCLPAGGDLGCMAGPAERQSTPLGALSSAWVEASPRAR